MKSKKLVSLLCAASMITSAFAAMATPAFAAGETTLWSDSFDGYENTVSHINEAVGQMLVDGTSIANNKYEAIEGVTLYTTNRADDSSYFKMVEGSKGKALMTTVSRFSNADRGAKIEFGETYAPTASEELVLAFKVKTHNENGTTFDTAMELNGSDANIINFDNAGVTADEWSDVKVVINASSGATVYIDGESKATLAAVKNLSSINFNGLVNGVNDSSSSGAQRSSAHPVGYPEISLDEMVVYTAADGAASDVPEAETKGAGEVEYEVVPQGVLTDKIEKMDVNEIASEDFNTEGTKDSNGRYIFTGDGKDKFDELAIVDLLCGTGSDARGDSNWKPVANANTDPALGIDRYLQANMGKGSGAGNGPAMQFKYGEIAERSGVSVSFAARLTASDTEPSEMIFSGSLDISGTKQNLIYPQAMITTNKDADSSVYAVDHALNKDNVLQVNDGEWFLVTMDTYRAEGKTATATINVTTYPKDADPVVTELYSGPVSNSTGNGINTLMNISFRAGNSNDWGNGSGTKAEFDNMVIGSTAAGAPEESDTPDVPETDAPKTDVKATIDSYNAETGDAAVTAETAADAKVAVIAAQYDTAGVLNSAKVVDATLKNGANTVKVPAKLAKGSKIMIWDSVNGMKPIAVYEVKDGAVITPAPVSTPTPTPTAEAKPTPTATAEAKPTPTATAEAKPTPTATAEVKPTPTATAEVKPAANGGNRALADSYTLLSEVKTDGTTVGDYDVLVPSLDDLAKDNRIKPENGGNFVYNPTSLDSKFYISYDIKVEDGDAIKFGAQNSSNLGTQFEFVGADGKLTVNACPKDATKVTDELKTGTWYNVLITYNTVEVNADTHALSNGNISIAISELDDQNQPKSPAVASLDGIGARNNSKNNEGRAYNTIAVDAGLTGTPMLNNFYIYTDKAEEEPTTAPSTEPSTEPSTVPSTEPSTAPSTEPSTGPIHHENDFTGEKAEQTAAGNGNFADDSAADGWYYNIEDASGTQAITAENGVLTAKGGGDARNSSHNKTYVGRHATKTIAEAEDATVTFDFDYKTDTTEGTGNTSTKIYLVESEGTVTNTNYNAVNSNWDLEIEDGSAGLGMTDPTKTYHVNIVADNANNLITINVTDSSASLQDDAATKVIHTKGEKINTIFFRPGRANTIKIANYSDTVSKGTPVPSTEPSTVPSGEPTDTPTGEPTGTPTAVPTGTPTAAPTGTPTAVPTEAPATMNPVPEGSPKASMSSNFNGTKAESAEGSNKFADNSAAAGWLL